MYLVLFLDQDAYQFVMSLHSTLAAAEKAFEALLRRFVIEDNEPLPAKSRWAGLCDSCGESVHLFGIGSTTLNPPRKSA